MIGELNLTIPYIRNRCYDKLEPKERWKWGFQDPNMMKSLEILVDFIVPVGVAILSYEPPNISPSLRNAGITALLWGFSHHKMRNWTLDAQYAHYQTRMDQYHDILPASFSTRRMPIGHKKDSSLLYLRYNQSFNQR